MSVLFARARGVLMMPHSRRFTVAAAGWNNGISAPSSLVADDDADTNGLTRTSRCNDRNNPATTATTRRAAEYLLFTSFLVLPQPTVVTSDEAASSSWLRRVLPQKQNPAASPLPPAVFNENSGWTRMTIPTAAMDLSSTTTTTPSVQDEEITTTTVTTTTSSSSSLWDMALWFIKRTYQPSIQRRKRKWGFLKRNRSKAGRKILNRRRNKGRKRLCGGIHK